MKKRLNLLLLALLLSLKSLNRAATEHQNTVSPLAFKDYRFQTKTFKIALVLKIV